MKKFCPFEWFRWWLTILNSSSLLNAYFPFSRPFIRATYTIGNLSKNCTIFKSRRFCRADARNRVGVGVGVGTDIQRGHERGLSDAAPSPAPRAEDPPLTRVDDHDEWAMTARQVKRFHQLRGQLPWHRFISVSQSSITPSIIDRRAWVIDGH